MCKCRHLLVSYFGGCTQQWVCWEKVGAGDSLGMERLHLSRHRGREFCGFQICSIFLAVLPGEGGLGCHH